MTRRPDPLLLSDGSLTARIRRGPGSGRRTESRPRDDDESALAELHRRHGAAVLGYARRYTDSEGAAQALAAEAFGRTVAGVRADRGPAGWRSRLAAAVEHTASDWSGGSRHTELNAEVRQRYELLRQGSRLNPVSAVPRTPGTPPHGFLTLPEESQSVLWLRLVDGQSPQEVAVILGARPEDIAALTARALRSLQAAYLRAHSARHHDDDCRFYGRLLVEAARNPDRPVRGLWLHVDACVSCRSLLRDLRRIESAPGKLIRSSVMPGAPTGGAFDAPGMSASIARQTDVGRAPGAALAKSRGRWNSWRRVAGCSTTVAAITTMCGVLLVPDPQAGPSIDQKPNSSSTGRPAAEVERTVSPRADASAVAAGMASASPVSTATASASPPPKATTPPSRHSGQRTAGPPTPVAMSTPSRSRSTTPTDAGLVNGGVETGAMAPWRAYNSAWPEASSPRTGSFALRLGAHPSGAEQDLMVAPNTTYRLSGWTVVTTEGDLATLGVKNYGGPELRAPVGATEYTYRTIEFTTGPDDSRATVYCFKAAGTEAAYCDDVTVTRM
jgi:DNA-directed RNA polymerase specialized sigma24 family protein